MRHKGSDTMTTLISGLRITMKNPRRDEVINYLLGMYYQCEISKLMFDLNIPEAFLALCKLNVISIEIWFISDWILIKS